MVSICYTIVTTICETWYFFWCWERLCNEEQYKGENLWPGQMFIKNFQSLIGRFEVGDCRSAMPGDGMYVHGLPTVSQKKQNRNFENAYIYNRMTFSKYNVSWAKLLPFCNILVSKIFSISSNLTTIPLHCMTCLISAINDTFFCWR